MKRFTKIIKWFIWNLIFGICLYLGIYNRITGFKNIAIFMIWFSSIISFSFYSDQVFNNMKNKYTKSVPYFVDTTFNVSVIMFLLFYSYIFSAIAATFHLINQTYFLTKIQKGENK